MILFAVRKDCERCGIGSRMVGAIQRFAREQSALHLIVLAAQSSPAAQRWWLRRGGFGRALLVDEHAQLRRLDVGALPESFLLPWKLGAGGVHLLCLDVDLCPDVDHIATGDGGGDDEKDGASSSKGNAKGKAKAAGRKEKQVGIEL